MATKIEINLPSINDISSEFGLGSGGKTQKFFANEILRISDPYVPFRDGFLTNSGTIGIDGTFIQYSTPYARRMWYGENFNFNTTFHPLATAKWVEKAVMIHEQELINAVNNFIRKGGA